MPEVAADVVHRPGPPGIEPFSHVVAPSDRFGRRYPASIETDGFSEVLHVLGQSIRAHAHMVPRATTDTIGGL